MRKLIFITFLLSVSISASVFMIIEPGSFFQNLYKSRDVVSFMGYWAAFLNEIFMAIMAGVRLPGKNETDSLTFHPVNIFFKTLLVLLFMTTVFGSSMNTIYPLVNTLHKQNNIKQVIRILESQVIDNEHS